MSITMQAIAILEALVILCLLLVITRRHQTAALVAGIGARPGAEPPTQTAQARHDAKRARRAWQATRAGRFDAPTRGASTEAGPDPRRSAAVSAQAGDNQLVSAAARSRYERMHPMQYVGVTHRHASGQIEALENSQSLPEHAYPRRDIERHFCEIVEFLPFAILLLDPGGLIKTVNPEITRLFGYERDELVSQRLTLLVPECGAGDDSSACAATRVSQRMESASPVPSSHELSARRKDGTEFRAEIGLNVFRFDEGATIVFIIDRTDQYELHRNRLDLAHLMRVSTMGQLASSLAHELNQPLTAILSNVQAAQRFMAADPIDLAEVREILNDIVQDDYRASEVIRRIRAVVKKGELEVAPLDLAGVIRDAVHLLRSDAIVRSTRVTLDLADDLPLVHADKVQLQQVMLNLLLNAFDAMNEIPPVDRAVLVTLRAAPHDSVCLAVSDKGHGLTSDKLDRIFKPFVTSKPHGLGLGLSISRTIIDMHHGRLWAENNRTRGATFYVTLPAGEAA